MTAATPPAPAPVPSAAPWFGRPYEHRQAAVAAVAALALCVGYWAATSVVTPEIAPGWVEFTGTFTALWCVWITRRQNILALPTGIVSVVLMGAFFWQIGLIGQAALHWVYYLPIQFWGWWMWTRGGAGRTELAVTWLPRWERAAYVPLLVVATLVFGWLIAAGWERALFTYWDASIVAASVTAQWLLCRKKVEAWWLWIIPVDVSAIGLYVFSGAYMFAALYAVFLVLATSGLVRWWRAASAAGHVASAVERPPRPAPVVS